METVDKYFRMFSQVGSREGRSLVNQAAEKHLSREEKNIWYRKIDSWFMNRIK